jgi:hypothetical protein
MGSYRTTDSCLYSPQGCSCGCLTKPRKEYHYTPRQE